MEFIKTAFKQSPHMPVDKRRSLYEQDFYAWTQQQASLLRRLPSGGVLDIENLIEEVESMGRSEVNSAKSAVREILIHLIKLQYSPATDPRRGWRESVQKQRDTLADLIETSPSLRRKIEGVFNDCWITACKRAAEQLADYGEKVTISVSEPFTLDQVLDTTFLPQR
jgi:hypothetical protein